MMPLRFVVTAIWAFRCESSACMTDKNGSSCSLSGPRSGGSVLLQQNRQNRHKIAADKLWQGRDVSIRSAKDVERIEHAEGSQKRGLLKDKSSFVSKCKFEVLDMDFDEPGEDGYEYLVCHDQEAKTTHYLRDDDVTSQLECGDLVTVVLEETEGESHGKHRPPWERESKPLYRAVEVQEKVPTSVLEMQRREKYGLSEHVNHEHKEMDILMIVCNYDDWQVAGTQDLIDALFVKDTIEDLSYTDGLNLSSLGRFSAPRHRSKFVNVTMGKNLTSVIGEDGEGCAFNDCFHTALEKIPEQYSDVDPDSYTFREFFIPTYAQGAPGNCGWAGLATVGCGKFSKLPNPGGCWSYNCHIGAWLRSHELGHNQGIIHPQSFVFQEADKDYGETWWRSDPQEIMFGPNSWNRYQLWQMGILHDKLPDVFTWHDPKPMIITLGSMSLPFERTGAEAASARIPCRCCKPLINPHSEDWGGLDYWLQYRGSTGPFAAWRDFYRGKVMVHLGHKTRGDGEFVAILSPGETYNPPYTPLFIHFCLNGTDAKAFVSMAYIKNEAKALCPGAVPPSQQEIERIVEAKAEAGFPGLVCDFPFSQDGLTHNDCVQLDGRSGTWCTSGRRFVPAGAQCSEEYDHDGNGADYIGCQNKTVSGKTCRRWDLTGKSYLQDGSASNFCRNPTGDAAIWCYTTDPQVRWDWCEPLGPKYFTCASTKPQYYPSCSITDGSGFSSVYPCQCGNVQCRSGRKCIAATSSCEYTCDETYLGKGETYDGCQSMTRSGKTCQRWDSNFPHLPSTHLVGLLNQDSRSSNFCRNPDGGSGGIWCYTTDLDTRWDYCDPLPISNPEQRRPDTPLTNPNTCFPYGNSEPSSAPAPEPEPTLTPTPPTPTPPTPTPPTHTPPTLSPSMPLPMAQATCGGNAGGAPCQFPFSYKGFQYTACTTAGHTEPWCYTTKSGTWGNCQCQTVPGPSLPAPTTPPPMPSAAAHATCGGNAGGAPCQLPFHYKGTQYVTCTSIDHTEPWCYTTKSGKWGNCNC